MVWWIVLLIVLGSLIVGFFLLTFLVYFFNLDTKFMIHVVNPILLRHYNKRKIKRDL
jgi:hypothetical protein